MRSLSAVLVVACVLLLVAEAEAEAAKVRYDGWRLVRARITTPQQLREVEGWGLDVWSTSLVIGDNDILVTDSHLAHLNTLNISAEILLHDIQNEIDREEQELIVRGSAVGASWFDTYHPYAEIVTFLQNISSSFPSLVTYAAAVGTTIQGRNIPAVVVTGTATGPKKRVIAIGGQHAREWIAPATLLDILEKLVTLYGNDATVTSLLDNTEIHIVPSANPDGYVFTWTTTRLWRKNRRANTGGSFGVDLNRNWNDHWGGDGSSRTPTSDTYCGTAPFSEPETQAISNWVIAKGPFSGAVDYHSYGQLIMRPYGWTNTPPPTESILKAVGDKWRDIIFAVNGVQYTSQPGVNLYFVSGGSRDYFYSEAKIPLSFTVELRDTGTNGFVLPAAQIIPTGEENWQGFKFYLEAIISNN